MMSWGKTPMTKSDGMLGLQLRDIKFDEKNIFLNQLFEKKLIKNKIFSLLYNDENSGGLFIGDYPNNETELLKNKKLRICKNNFGTNGTILGIIFDKIIFTKKYKVIITIFKIIKNQDIK